MASADFLDQFLIVFVILAGVFYIREEVSLRFGRYVICAESKAQGCVRAAIRPRASLSGCRILRQPVAAGVVLVAGVPPGP